MNEKGKAHYELQEYKHRGHDHRVLQVRRVRQLAAQEELKGEAKGEDRKTPQCSEGGRLEHTIQVHANEHDDAEVCVESVGDEHRTDHQPPTD
ncbi:hypothetical protein E2C01_022547 [Portunus trituberculatus]|uniref:Uncharacterized protein n=1 Tax=Portunus trituberculatus TaxID=210409 RepID=A0A5B7E7C7_PORTR|nr:hypothetical protein [Portunus trituberculatus]